MQWLVWPRSRQATEVVSPAADRTGVVPVQASRNAPVPKVHLASPAWMHASPSRAACWSTISPVTGSSPPKTRVVPTIASFGTIAGSGSAARPNTSSSSPFHATSSRPTRRERLAVEASVTNAPHSWCTSQVSLVVTTPPVVTFSRSQRILGGEVGVQDQPGQRGHPRSGAGQPGAQGLGAAVLPHHGGAERAAGGPVPGQHGLAL